MPPARHPYHKMMVVVSGSGAVIAADEHALEPGMVVLIPAGTLHHFEDRHKQPLCLLAVCLDPSIVQSNPVIAAPWRAIVDRWTAAVPRRIGDEYRRGRIERRIHAMIFEQTRSHHESAAAMWGHLLGLLAEVARAFRRPTRGVTSPATAFDGTLTWIEHHFHEPVRVPELAARARMSYRGYTARFRAVTGASVVTHLTRLRIEHARKLLRSGMPIIDASLSSGFDDLSNFYRHFKRATGTSPARCDRT
ncbi:MAG: AraC family transcriptional regulator [Planctomycetes bacterium]|nr:AraC family transcriptional regulator [Planctomycetota bacterium]